MENQRKKEQAERGRQAGLHRATLVMDGNDIRLVSKTVQSWREGLSDKEFADLIRTLFNRLPDLERKQGFDFGTTATRHTGTRRSPSY